MNLCSDGHEEVCFEGRICPVCEKQKEVDGLMDELGELKEELRLMELDLAGE